MVGGRFVTFRFIDHGHRRLFRREPPDSCLEQEVHSVHNEARRVCTVKLLFRAFPAVMVDNLRNVLVEAELGACHHGDSEPGGRDGSFGEVGVP